MKLAAHDERPGIVEAFLRIGSAAEPGCGDGGLFGGLSEDFVFAIPALLVGLRGKRASGVVGQLELALIGFEASGFARADV